MCVVVYQISRTSSTLCAYLCTPDQTRARFTVTPDVIECVCVGMCEEALSRGFTRPVASQKFPQLSIINLINMTLQIPARSLIPLAALPAIPDAWWKVGMASFATVGNGVSPGITVIVNINY